MSIVNAGEGSGGGEWQEFLTGAERVRLATLFRVKYPTQLSNWILQYNFTLSRMFSQKNKMPLTHSSVHGLNLQKEEKTLFSAVLAYFSAIS